MSEYWKSNPRKYCEMCKCWLGDNKASIDFHERGKNHKENVKRKLAEIKMKSIEKRKEDESAKEMLANIEKAAIDAMKKDITSNSNAVFGKNDLKHLVETTKKEDLHHVDTDTSQGNPTYPWTAVQAPQGYTYYYNSNTGESTWEVPEIVQRYKEEQQSKQELKLKVEDKPKNSKDPYRQTTTPDVEERDKHHLLGGWKVVREETKDHHPILGSWSSVEITRITEETPAKDHTEETSLSSSTDIPSPQLTKESSSEVTDRKAGAKFKEKILKTPLTSSDSDAPVAFKKRKSGSRNVRKREADDD